MGGAEGKPTEFGAGGGGVGTEGEPELCILCAEGKPIALSVGGAEGKPAQLGAGGGRGGVGTDGEPAFLFFLALVSIGEITGLLQKLFAVVAAGVAAVAAVAAPPLW